MVLSQEYLNFISLVTSRGLSGQYTQYYTGINGDILAYHLFAYDGPHLYECDIQDANSVTHFEQNYKNSWNQPIEKRDAISGLIQVIPKPVYATLYGQFIYITTGTINNFYKPNDYWSIDVSAPGITKITMSPNFSYYIDGGGYKLIGNKDGNAIITFILAPNIPSQYGGNVCFIENKRVLRNNDSFFIEAPPKFIRYYSENPYANQIQIKIEHDIHSTMDFEFFIRMYRSKQ